MTVSAGGASPARLVPWAGVVDLKAPESAFREPPESQLTIRDMVSCSDLVAATEKLDAVVSAAIRSAAGVP